MGVVDTWVDVPDLSYRVEATAEIRSVTAGQGDAVERQLAARIVDRAFTEAFVAQPGRFWRARWNQFFRNEPENAGSADDLVNAFRGVRFSTLFPGGEAHLAADVLTRYFGRKSLSEHTAEEREDRLHDHVSNEVKFEFRSLFVRDNGSIKYSCRYSGPTGRTVSEFRLTARDNQTIAAYYAEKYPGVRLLPDDEAVFVTDHGRPDAIPVPASRLFPVFTTEDEGMKSCATPPWMSPADRLQAIHEFLATVPEVRVDGEPVRIEAGPVTRARSILRPPTLEFGGGHSLACAGGDTPTDQEFISWRNGKTTALYKYGPFSPQPLPDVMFLFPETLARDQREDFLRRLGDELQALTGHRLNVVGQRFYRLGTQAWTGANLLAEAEAVATKARGLLLPVVVLSPRFARNVYPQLKSRFASLPSQCVDERTLHRILGDQPNSSRLRNLALGIMTAAGIQPWVLGEPLAHDFYMGLDVFQNQVGYTFFYGRGGRCTRLEFGESFQRNSLAEAIDPVELRAKLDSGLRQARAANFPLSSVVIHRDGRWWPKERQALTLAIAELRRADVLAPDCRVAVVEVKKSHLPVRLVTKRGAQWENPMPGSYWPLDERSAILTTTGKPGVWDRQGRTASTILLELAQAEGEFDVEELARDAYWLTHLNWNAPEIEISLPVTIRWNDDALRYALLQPAEGEDEGEGDEAA
jgi:hypothetical protein